MSGPFPADRIQLDAVARKPIAALYRLALARERARQHGVRDHGDPRVEPAHDRRPRPARPLPGGHARGGRLMVAAQRRLS